VIRDSPDRDKVYAYQFLPTMKTASANHTISNNLVAIAGFPKSGNTLINETLNYAGRLVDQCWMPPKYEFQNPKEITKFEEYSFTANPFLGDNKCHLKTHLAYSEDSYIWPGRKTAISSIVVIIRNPFDTLLSSTNYLRYSAALNNRLTANQIATLKHFYPNHTEADVIDPDVFNLKSLREEGALDKALEIFSTSNTCIPQFLARSGTWNDFYASFSGSDLPVLRIRFEDIVNTNNQWQEVSGRLASFLDGDPVVLAEAFARQNEECRQARKANDLFFPVAESNYFHQYFEAKTLRRFCNKNLQMLKSVGYEDLADSIMSS
jgi:hypothetical protein